MTTGLMEAISQIKEVQKFHFQLIMKDNLQRVSGNSNQLNKLNRELNCDSNKLTDLKLA
jgi:hypothetical protein